MPAVHDTALLRIGELSRRSGVSPDVLRVWERRYGLLRPERTDGRLPALHRRRRGPGALHAPPPRPRLLRLGRGAHDARRADPPERGRARGRPRRGARPISARRSRTSATSTPRRSSTGSSRPSASRPSCATSCSPTCATSATGGRRGSSRPPRSTSRASSCAGGCSASPAASTSGSAPGRSSPARRASATTSALLCFGIGLRDRGWRITYLGADTPLETLADAAEAPQPRPRGGLRRDGRAAARGSAADRPARRTTTSVALAGPGGVGGDGPVGAGAPAAGCPHGGRGAHRTRGVRAGPPARRAREDELPRVMALRHAVFCVEQGVPADLEYDGLDAGAVHVVVVDDEQGDRHLPARCATARPCGSVAWPWRASAAARASAPSSSTRPMPSRAERRCPRGGAARPGCGARLLRARRLRGRGRRVRGGGHRARDHAARSRPPHTMIEAVASVPARPPE